MNFDYYRRVPDCGTDYICVRAYKDCYIKAIKRKVGDLLYLGQNVAEAAAWLDPGTVFWSAPTEELADAGCKLEVEKQQPKEAA